MCFFGKMLTQIRLGLSPLRHYLFTYNLTDNPFCASCGLFVEDNSHYFLNCKSYNNYRIELTNDLTLIIAKINKYPSFESIDISYPSIYACQLNN